jgi:ribosome recycling factor
LVKHLHGVLENHRTAARNIRRDAKEAIQRLYKDKKVSEDDERRGLDGLEKVTHEFVEKLESMAKSKEKEVMSV